MNYLFLYLGVMLLVMVLYARRKRRINTHHTEKLHESIESGLTEPPTLHPVVDLARCMGSGACVKACPERALGVVNGKAVLINAAHCIGHGACRFACPVEAINKGEKKYVIDSEKCVDCGACAGECPSEAIEPG